VSSFTTGAPERYVVILRFKDGQKFRRVLEGENGSVAQQTWAWAQVGQEVTVAWRTLTRFGKSRGSEILEVKP
jgi:hypothetical protein